MRVDNIDLIGEFKIQGLTAAGSQALGMSGGSLTFIEVTGGVGGSNAGLSKPSGYNYIFVQATGNDISNGTKLLNAYSQAITLIGQIGTPGVDNRVSILLTPGIYDLNGSYLDLNTSFIDIIGVSTNPQDTILKTTGGSHTLAISNGVDTALHNLHLMSGTQFSITDGGSGTGTFLRWKNLILSGNGFYDPGTNTFGLGDIDGEFENITVNTGTFAAANANISGNYKNINLGSISIAFWSLTGNISGTFVNIYNTESFGDIFYSDSSGTISGRFENIRLDCNSISVFYIQVGGSIDGTFKNIQLLNSPSNCFYGPISDTSYFKDITISDSIALGGNVFVSSSGNLGGTYRNIKIGNVDGNVFQTSAVLNGDFYDIKIGNVTSYCFSGDSIFGTYEKIIMGNCGDLFIPTTTMIANVKNITGNSVSGSIFSQGTIYGNYENITFGNVGSNAFACDLLDGVYRNIKIDNVGGNAFYSFATTISGKFKDISVKCSSELFSGTSLNLELEYLNASCPISFKANDILGTFSNIDISSVSSFAFYAQSTDLNIRLDNCNIKTSDGATIFNALGNINGLYKNIIISGTAGDVFSCGGNLNPQLIENFEIDTVDTLAFSSTQIDGFYKNIKANNITSVAFAITSGSLYGTYSNIHIGECFGNIFNATVNIGVNIDDLFVGTASTMFMGGASTTSTTKVNRLVANTNFCGYNVNTIKYFFGLLCNSSINMIGRNDYLNIDTSGQIERCKILTNTGANSLTGDGKVFYTITNEGQNITTGPTFGNIVDSDVVS